MRNTIFTFIGVALLVGFVACDDWTSPEKLDVENEAVGDLYSKRDSIKWAEEEKRHKENEAAYEKYLENLRAYKSTKHPIMCGDRAVSLRLPGRIRFRSILRSSFYFRQRLFGGDIRYVSTRSMPLDRWGRWRDIFE